ncbi:hypothetical protein AGLY_014577 [Aphis glycines]|uniref:Uncharacterized protein n=1 Tax=Aphis glycines TaxID=307491 RepID=A0A6G0T3P6_APHGL|nr:hypothetical protein AGLY_014577 [Aphis glycines]
MQMAIRTNVVHQTKYLSNNTFLTMELPRLFSMYFNSFSVIVGCVLGESCIKRVQHTCHSKPIDPPFQQMYLHNIHDKHITFKNLFFYKVILWFNCGILMLELHNNYLHSTCVRKRDFPKASSLKGPRSKILLCLKNYAEYWVLPYTIILSNFILWIKHHVMLSNLTMISIENERAKKLNLSLMVKILAENRITEKHQPNV